MADKKISELNSANLPLTGSEELVLVQGGETKKVPVSEVGGGGSLKKIVYSITQSGTDDPIFNLLENNSSLDLSGSVFTRNQQGRYTLEIITNDASLFSKFFPSVIGNINSGNSSTIQVFKNDLIGKLGRIDLEVLTFEEAILKDDLLLDTLLEIYINE